MAKFTTRVELHNATTRDSYDRLHQEMERRGFTRLISSDDGVTYHLPPAEYNFEGNGTRQQILDLAKDAASKVDRSYSVLVTESAGRTWFGLKQI